MSAAPIVEPAGSRPAGHRAVPLLAEPELAAELAAPESPSTRSGREPSTPPCRNGFGPRTPADRFTRYHADGSLITPEQWARSLVAVLRTAATGQTWTVSDHTPEEE